MLIVARFSPRAQPMALQHYGIQFDIDTVSVRAQGHAATAPYPVIVAFLTGTGRWNHAQGSVWLSRVAMMPVQALADVNALAVQIEAAFGVPTFGSLQYQRRGVNNAVR